GVGLVRGEPAMALVALVLAGAALGFLPYNFPQARVYLGDVGSTFLGLVLGVVALLQNHKAAVALTLLVPLVAMGLPLLDTTLAVVRRTARGTSPLRGDLGHLHHRLLAIGWPPTQVVACLLAITGGLGLV